MSNDAGPFEWKKFFSGLVSPLNFAKSFVFLIQASIITLVILAVLFLGLSLKRKLLPGKKIAAQFSTSNTCGGTVHNSNDEVKKKFGVIVL